MQFKDLADWSSLPRDLYVTAVKSDGVVFEVQCCSVPMAIGPEVRYSMNSALYSNREDSITVSKKITSTPAWDAVHAFDAENSVEPFRAIAERIAYGAGCAKNHQLVDDISGALEDAYSLGERRGPLVAAATNGGPS